MVNGYKISDEMIRLLNTRQVTDYTNLDKSTRNRYEQLLKLQNDLTNIKAEVLQHNTTETIDLIGKFKEKAGECINKCLQNVNLDKYSMVGKFFKGLLNLLIFPALCKLVVTCGHSFFYSTEGKSKETVREVLTELNNFQNTQH